MATRNSVKIISFVVVYTGDVVAAVALIFNFFGASFFGCVCFFLPLATVFVFIFIKIRDKIERK